LLQDLTSVFSGREDFQFVYAYGSAVDLKKKEISGSRRLWDVVSKEERTAGYKTDVMLRAIGSVHLTNIRVFQDFTSKMNEKKHDFDIRSRTLKHYFFTQLDTNVTRGYPMDELFCLIYLVLHADEPDPDFHGATEEQLIQLERLKPVLFDMFAAQSTDDVTQM